MRPGLIFSTVFFSGITLAACGSVDRSQLNDPTQNPADAALDSGSVGPDTSLLDLGMPPIDVNPVDVTPPDVGVPDVGGPDVPMCTACAAATNVTFCPASGTGELCADFAGCERACRVCRAPVVSGDNCSSYPTIMDSGHTTLVMTTCGMHDDLTVGCGGGSDIVFRLRLATTGRITVRATTPAATTLVMSYDDHTGRCANNTGPRTCLGGTAPNERGISGMASAGDYFFFIATAAPATVVIDADLP